MNNNVNEYTLARNLSPMGAWAFAIGTSIGWGSLVVTSNTYLAQAGPLGSVIGIVIGTIIMLIISRNYAYMVQCYPEAGGAYTYAKEVFGHDYGFLTAWFLALTYLAILWANATSLPLFARYFLGDMFRFGKMYTLFGYDVYIGEVLLSSVAIVVVALLCSRYKQAIFRTMIVMALLFTVGITVVFVVAVLRHNLSFSPAYVPDTKAVSQIVKIAVISPWAFIGFENISHGAEEFSFKRTKIFRILVISVIFTMLLYVFILILSVSAYPPEYDSWLAYIRDIGNLDGLKALPAFYAANYYMGGFGVVILILSLFALVVTSLIGNITALSRLFYALGRDRILPAKFGELNRHSVPGRSVFLVAVISVFIPLLGRTPIGWIVDVTTIGSTIIYGLVSASTRKLADSRQDRTEKWTGMLGLCLMVGFLLYLLAPSLVSVSSLAKETYFLFIIWSVLGFVFFRRLLGKDTSRRFGKSVIVWVALLALVLFIALIWMRQSMIASNNQMMMNIQEHYSQTADDSEIRLEDEIFIEQEMNELQSEDTRTILMATGMFVFALIIMMANYTYMNKRTKESEKIANTDPLTGVKSRHAYLIREKAMNAEIGEGLAEEFAIVICDVNDLKYVNDTYGHKAGDDYLRSASAIVCELFDHSPVFRVGGDEFVVILTGRDYENRDDIMESLHKRSEENIGTGRVVVAAGISDYRSGEDKKVHSVFERADELMYQKKKELKEIGARARCKRDGF